MGYVHRLGRRAFVWALLCTAARTYFGNRHLLSGTYSTLAIATVAANLALLPVRAVLLVTDGCLA